MKDYVVPPQLHRLQRPAPIIAGIGVLFAIVGALLDLEQFWQSYLFCLSFLAGDRLGISGICSASSPGWGPLERADPTHYGDWNDDIAVDGASICAIDLWLADTLSLARC